MLECMRSPLLCLALVAMGCTRGQSRLRRRRRLRATVAYATPPPIWRRWPAAATSGAAWGPRPRPSAKTGPLVPIATARRDRAARAPTARRRRSSCRRRWVSAVTPTAARRICSAARSRRPRSSASRSSTPTTQARLLLRRARRCRRRRRDLHARQPVQERLLRRQRHLLQRLPDDFECPATASTFLFKSLRSTSSKGAPVAKELHPPIGSPDCPTRFRTPPVDASRRSPLPARAPNPSRCSGLARTVTALRLHRLPGRSRRRRTPSAAPSAPRDGARPARGSARRRSCPACDGRRSKQLDVSRRVEPRHAATPASPPVPPTAKP